MRIRVRRARRRAVGGRALPAACSGTAGGRALRAQVTRLVVEVANRAQSWRDAALDAETSFRSWQAAGAQERADAAAAYLAAIEREEKAADEYRRASAACCASPSEVQRSIAARRETKGAPWRLSYGAW